MANGCKALSLKSKMEILKLSEINTLPSITDGPKAARNLLILAHGAGAPMDTDFMNYFARELASEEVKVLRFEFPYMARRREGHGRRPPNPKKILLQCWKDIIANCREKHQGPIFIGGKSMGGRMASMIADESTAVSGLVLLGYPFYATGKLDKPRIDHLANIKTPGLILQGERDPMGSKEVVENYNLSKALHINWLADGNHDLKPRVRSGKTHDENLAESIVLISKFISKNS